MKAALKSLELRAKVLGLALSKETSLEQLEAAVLELTPVPDVPDEDLPVATKLYKMVEMTPEEVERFLHPAPVKKERPVERLETKVWSGLIHKGIYLGGWCRLRGYRLADARRVMRGCPLTPEQEKLRDQLFKEALDPDFFFPGYWPGLEDEIKAGFKAKGTSMAQWCRENGEHPSVAGNAVRCVPVSENAIRLNQLIVKAALG